MPTSEPRAEDVARRLIALAEGAVAGSPMDRDCSTGDWRPYFNFHGDPYVVERGRGMWGLIATLTTAPEDYGRGRAWFMGAADPNTVTALANVALAAAAILHPERGDAPWLHTAEFDALRAALDALSRADLSDKDEDPDSVPLGPDGSA